MKITHIHTIFLHISIICNADENFLQYFGQALNRDIVYEYIVIVVGKMVLPAIGLANFAAMHIKDSLMIHHIR